jgi:hypothetical protein
MSPIIDFQKMKTISMPCGKLLLCHMSWSKTMKNEWHGFSRLDKNNFEFSKNATRCQHIICY